jgi:hypothetical protein
MKLTLTGLIMGVTVTSLLLAQQPPPDHRPGGFPGFGDPARRMEMMVDRLAEDIGLNRDQRKEMKDICDKAQTSAKPLQDELQNTRKAIKEAVKTGKQQEELKALHQQIGASHAKLAAIESAAFADALKLLTDNQKNDADFVFEFLGLIVGSGGRVGMPIRGAPGGFGGPGDRPPGGRGSPGWPRGGFAPVPKPPRGR